MNAIKKEGAHLQRPNERGEHAFSNFIRELTANSHGHEGHDHAGTTGHGCSCGFIVQLGDIVTRGEK